MRTKILILLLTVAGFYFLITCKKVEKQMMVTTGTVSNILTTSASVGGELLDLGEGVSQHGHCWSENPDPDLNEFKTTLGARTSTGVFTSNLAELTPGTKYYVRAYCSRGADTKYGDEKNFTTIELAVPSLATTAISNLATTSATSGGTITSTGGTSIIMKGVCWNTSPNPTISNFKSEDGSGAGSFVSNLESLLPSTTYYVRAYATNSVGTGYGNELSFSTLCTPPTAVATDASGIGSSTATLNGSVNANGFSTTVTFEYGTNTGYGTSVAATPSAVAGSGINAVSAAISGLASNTTYHFRVKAVNCGGTIYSTDHTFATFCLPPSATTNSPTNVGTTTVTFNGLVNPNNAQTTVTFEYGTTLSYGVSVQATPYTVTGSGSTAVNSTVTGLTPNTLYHYILKTVNCGGTTYGTDQTFTTPLCPSSLTLTHTAGTVAPVTKTLTYGVVETNLTGQNKCWITKNLGADNQPGSATDASESAAGWYWQFNRKQGFKHDGTTRTPNITWMNSINEASNWSTTNDPCAILLGTGWRIPTFVEWSSTYTTFGWDDYNIAFASVLKFHTGGSLAYTDGSLYGRGTWLYYYSSTDKDGQYNSWGIYASNSYFTAGNTNKANAFAIRCIKD